MTPSNPAPSLLDLPTPLLRQLIRERVEAVGERSDRDDDWRIGAVARDVRLELRRYFPDAPTPAAVLVPIVDRGDSLTVLLTERASALRHHAGQISFPGGTHRGDGRHRDRGGTA
jgi:hypothetical protein